MVTDVHEQGIRERRTPDTADLIVRQVERFQSPQQRQTGCENLSDLHAKRRREGDNGRDTGRTKGAIAGAITGERERGGGGGGGDNGDDGERCYRDRGTKLLFST